MTMTNTRLTALETEVPIVPRTGKIETQSSAGGDRRELFTCTVVYVFLCTQDFMVLVFARNWSFCGTK